MEGANGSERDFSGSVFLVIRSYEEARELFSIYLTVSLVLIVLGIVVNVIICMIMICKKRYKRNASNFFILHLSTTELVYRLLVFPAVIYFAIPRSGIKSLHCKLVCFFSETCRSAIFVSLVAIAIDRYQHIVRPLESLKSKKKRAPLVSVVWLYATISSCPRVISVESVSVTSIPEARDMECNNCADMELCDIPQNPLGQFSTALYFILAFVVPLVFIFALYTKIVIFLHHRGNNGMMHKVAARSKSKAVRMLIITVIGYVLSLGPAVVFSTLRSYGVLNENSIGVMLLANWLVDFATYLSSLGNPLIYAYYSKDFRNELFQLRCCKKD